MNITFACPACDQAARVALEPAARELVCPHCKQPLRIPEGAIEEGRVTRCLVCPSTDLYVRKDFPQRLGVGIVAVGIVGSSIAWAYTMIPLTFAILFATALVDVVLYALVGDALMCYRCDAQYRDLPGLEGHEAFDLETHERYRQLAARLEQTKKLEPSQKQ